MPSNFYTQFYTASTLTETEIINAWIDARDELNAQGAPDTWYLEINYTSGKIRRTYDDTEVNTLSDSEQRRLYPQLNGLFQKAVFALLMP